MWMVSRYVVVLVWWESTVFVPTVKCAELQLGSNVGFRLNSGASGPFCFMFFFVVGHHLWREFNSSCSFSSCYIIYASTPQATSGYKYATGFFYNSVKMWDGHHIMFLHWRKWRGESEVELRVTFEGTVYRVLLSQLQLKTSINHNSAFMNVNQSKKKRQ